MMFKILFEDPNLYLTWILLVVFSVCCHEYAHARASLWQGDPTAAMLGHLTINPLKQMGIISLIMLFFIGIAWGAVPVVPRNMKHKYSPALVAFAGPFMNLILFLVFCLLIVFFSTGRKELANLFFYGAVINIVLFIFNMLPIPILDGYTVFTYLFPGIYKINSELANGITFFLFLVLFMSFEYIMNIGVFITLALVGFIHNLLIP